MAEKTTTKKRSTAAKQELAATLADVQRETQERREADVRPEDRLEERAVRAAVAAADGLSLDGVMKDISQLKSGVAQMLAQIGERLEAEIDKYRHVRKAIEVKEKELAEIYEIQKATVNLAVLLETQQHKREDFEADMARQKEELEREIQSTRAMWDEEVKMREAETKERETAESKRRQREQDEYKYAFAREQQLAKDQFADEKARLEREAAVRREQLERELKDRESALAAREAELKQLKERADRFPAELQAAVTKAVADATAKIQSESAGREELLKNQFAGERNVLTTRIASLEQAIAEQTKQVAALSQKLEKAYAQVQDIAVKAIEGSSNARTISSLQQLLAEQGRKAGQEK